MKKFTKILIPVLVLSLLVGLFAVIATANDEIADTAVKGDPKFVSLASPGEGESATDASYTAYNGENVEYRLYSSSLASKSYYGYLKVGEVTTDTTVADPETGALTRQYYYTAISFDIATANQWFPNLTVKIHGRVYKYNMSNGQQVDNEYGIFGALSDFSQFENDAPFTWHNVTILFDYSNGTWNLYIDGEFVKTATESLVKAGEVEIKSLDDTRFQPEWSGLSGEASMAMTKVTAWNYAGKSDLANLFDGTCKSLSEANVKLPYMTADDITPAPAAAAIGEKQYETLADAVAEWQKGDVIKLLRDVSNFYFETDAVVDTNGFSLGYDFSDDYNAFENDGVVTVQYYEDYEGSNFAYVVFQYPDGTVISRTEYSIPVGAVVPKSIIPADLTSPAAEYLGFAAGAGVNGELIKGKFYVENPVVVPGFGSETDNVVYFTAVPGQIYENVAAAVQDETGAYIQRYSADQLATFEAAYRNATSGYKYHLLVDYTFTQVAYGGKKNTLVLHGVTATWTNPTANNRFFYNGVNTVEGVTVGGVKGKLSIASTNGYTLYFSDNAAAAITFKNVDVSTDVSISDARGGSITLIDSNLHCTGAGHALQLLHRENNTSYSLTVTNSTISSYASDDNGKYSAAVRLIAYSNELTGISFTCKIDGNSKIFTTCDKNSNAIEISTCAQTANLYIGKDVEVKAGNGYFGIKNYNPNLVVTIEEGFSWTASAAPNFTNVANGNFKVADKEGAYGYFKQVDDKFVWTAAENVVKLTFDVNGTVTTIPLIDGATEYTAPAAPQSYTVVNGKIVVSAFSHWAATANGEAVTVDPTKDGTYYAVFTQVEATWVVYGANDAILAAGAETMPADAINTTGAVKVVLYGDNTLDLSAGVKCVNDIVFDLSGKALTTAGKDRYNLGGCSVTFRNGTLNVKHGANLFYGAGNVYFETVTINSERTVIDFRSNGVISLTDCVVNHNSASNSVFSLGGDAEHTNFVAKNTVVNLVDTDFGTENDEKETIYFVQTSSMKRYEVQQKVFSTITFDNVTVNAGDGTAFRMAFDAGEESLVNIYLKNGTKIFTNRSVISDGGTANLLTVFHVDETVVLGVTGILNSMRYELGEGKVLVYDDEKGGYVVGDFVAPTEVLGNLTLYTDINFNFFVAVNGNNRYTFAINGVAVSTTVTKINGKDYYRIAYKGIKVYDAAEGEFVLTLETVNGVAVNAELATCSVLDYAKIVLGSDMGVTAKTLVANVVDYIAAAYVYDTNSETLPDKLAAVMASEDYKAAVAEYNRGAIAKSDANAEGAKKAIASVQLNVTSGFKYRLNLASDYTGTLTVNGVQYNVENGKTGENTYIEITILACNMLVNNITVVDEANEINGSFDLEYYIEADKTVEDGKGELNKLLEALYYYCEAATRFEALARG